MLNFKTWIICISGSAFAQMSFAMPVVQTAACVNNSAVVCATGVTGLDVLGSLYDVDFSLSSYDNLFATTTPTFLDNEAGAIAATDALTTVFNDAGVTRVIGEPVSTGLNSVIIPFEVIGQFTALAYIAFYDSEGFFSGPFSIPIGREFTNSINTPQLYNVTAIFAPSTGDVPAPPVLALFGLGLAGLGWSHRKKT